MDKPKSSVVKAIPKPVSVFYVWYSELCRRLNINPAPSVKPTKPKCQTVLDFVADRLKVEDWSPVVNALRQDTSLHVIAVRSRIGNCPFLHDVDTEEKARKVKRKYGSIWTSYVLKQLLKSLSFSLRSTQVLTYLELEGLPLFMQYLEPLMQALKRNKTLKSLSLANCQIQDTGCQLVCSYLRFTPNIEILNLSGCNLSPVSGEHVAKLIKYQQINRYCESWHSSLRYENPDAGKMRGIKRITINSNAFFGDAGLNFILDELEDDLWVKALDMQKCGFTQNISAKILDVVEYNKTLEIVDLRRNELLGIDTVEKVLHILKQRQQFGLKTEFQWCATAVSLTWSTIYSSASKTSVSPKTIHKTRSAPMKSGSSKACGITSDYTLRKTKTAESINKGVRVFPVLQNTKRQVLDLNNKLQQEIQKRKEIEKRNEELQSQLEYIKTTSNISSIESSRRSGIKVNKEILKINGVKRQPFNNLNVKAIEVKKTSTRNQQQQVLDINNKSKKEIQKGKEIEKGVEKLQCQLKYINKTSNISSMDSSRQSTIKVNKETVKTNGFKQYPVNNLNVKATEVRKKTIKDQPILNPLVIRRKVGKKAANIEQSKTVEERNGIHKNGTINGMKTTNKIFKHPMENNNVYNILEKILRTGRPLHENFEDDISNYFEISKKKPIKIQDNGMKRLETLHSVSSSQLSLFKYMEELKANNT